MIYSYTNIINIIINSKTNIIHIKGRYGVYKCIYIIYIVAYGFSLCKVRVLKPRGHALLWYCSTHCASAEGRVLAL